MSKRYHEIMENIQLTTETREQILRHVSERERKAKVQTMKKWTKYLSVAACCALVVGAAYGIHTLHPDKTVSEEEDMTTTDVADDGAQCQIRCRSMVLRRTFPMPVGLPLKRSENWLYREGNPVFYL